MLFSALQIDTLVSLGVRSPNTVSEVVPEIC